MLAFLKQYLQLASLRKKFPGTRLHAPCFVDREALSTNRIHVSEGVELLSGARLTGSVTLGAHSYFSFGVEVYASKKFPITIGKFCSVATGVCIISSHHHNPTTIANYPITERMFGIQDEPSGGEIVIGNDVWIGARAVILPGVTIGDGAIIGAGSIVTSGTIIKPYEVWAGNPAKKIKDRFPKEALERMKMMTWWEWDVAEIKKNREMFIKPVM